MTKEASTGEFMRTRWQRKIEYLKGGLATWGKWQRKIQYLSRLRASAVVVRSRTKTTAPLKSRKLIPVSQNNLPPHLTRPPHATTTPPQRRRHATLPRVPLNLCHAKFTLCQIFNPITGVLFVLMKFWTLRSYCQEVVIYTFFYG